MFFYILFLPAFVLYVIPCLLPRPLLWVYAVLAAVGLAIEWRSSLTMMRSGEGGISEVFGLIVLFGATVGAGGGIAARMTMLALRRRGLRWRYAWLPGPIILAGLIAATFLSK